MKLFQVDEQTNVSSDLTPKLVVLPKSEIAVEISFFADGYAGREMSINKSLLQILREMHQETWQSEIQSVRRHYKKIENTCRDSDEAAQQKKEYERSKSMLPCFLVSMTSKARQAESLLSHTGLLQIDIDGLENLQKVNETKDMVFQDDHILAAWISTSGRGVKAIMRIPADPYKHEESFGAAERYFREVLGVSIDKNAGNINQLCCVAYDPNLQYREIAKELDVEKWQTVVVNPINDDPDPHEFGDIDGSTANSLSCDTKTTDTDCLTVNTTLEDISNSLNIEDLIGTNVPSLTRGIFDSGLEECFSLITKQLTLNYESAVFEFLANASVALGGRKSLHVAPNRIEQGCLWMALIGRSGSGKTPLHRACGGAYLDSVHQSWHEEYQAKLRDDPRPDHERKRLKIDTTTMESLCEYHVQNPVGLAYCADEFLTVINGLNQYKNGGNDKQKILTIWNCHSFESPTLNSDRFIPEVYVPINGGIQDSKLKKIINEDNVADGLAARILFCHLVLGDHPLSYEQHQDLARQYAGASEGQLERILGKLIAIRNNLNVIQLSESANRILFDLNYELDKLARKEDDVLFAAYRKLQIYTYRIALVLHYILEPEPDKDSTLSKSTAEKTLYVMQFFLGNMKLAYTSVELTKQQKCARKILQKLRTSDGPVAESILKKAVERITNNAKESMGILRQLLEMGAIQCHLKGKANYYVLADKL